MKQFTFPLSFNDIQKPQCFNITNYTVEPHDQLIDLGERQILNRLKSFDEDLFHSYDAITNPKHFDFLYWLVNNNPDFKSTKVLERLCESVYAASGKLTEACMRMDSASNLQGLRVAFKMAMFMAFFFISSTLVKKKAAQGDIIAEAMNKQARKKKKGNLQTESFKTIGDRQKQMLSCINRSLQIDLTSLWQKQGMDQDFLKYYANIGLKILESTLGKDQDIRDIIFNILEVVLKNKPEIFKQLQLNIINLLYEEDVVDNLVHFFGRAESESVQIQKLCSDTMIMTVACLSTKTNSNNAESQAIKNTRQFLSKLSQSIPRVFYNNLQFFIRLYDSQSYLLRNAITQILSNIIRQVLNTDTQQSNRNKDRFIMTLLTRIHDKNSHARTFVLNILGQLVSDNIAPKNRLIYMLKAGVDRLKDIGVLTRKRAVTLIYNVLKVYQYIYSKNSTFRTRSELVDDLATLKAEQKNYEQEIERLNEETKNIADQETLNIHMSDLKLIRKNLQESETLQEFYQEYLSVLEMIGGVTDTLGLLLGSKNLNDVVEVIKLFIFLKQLGIEGIDDSLKKINMLVFSKEKGVKEEVLRCFSMLYLSDNNPKLVADKLIQLFNDANLQDLTCLQEIIESLIDQGKKKAECEINRAVYQNLWDRFIYCLRSNTNQGQRRACISILRVVFNADQTTLKPAYIASFLQILRKYSQSGACDYSIVKQIAKIIQKCPERLASESKSFLMYLVKILILDSSDNTGWYSACQQTLTAIFSLCEYPQQYSQLLIMQLHRKLRNDESSISRFIFTLSHSSLKLLIHLDSLEMKLKKLRQQADKHKSDEELDKVMGGVEGEFEKRIEKLQALADAIVQDPFVAKWLRIIEHIVRNTGSGTELERTAVLAYCKFMCISEKYCQEQMPTLFSILTKPNMDPVIKNNIIISMGDLLHRFPNPVQPHSQYLYQNLHDPNPAVRKTTMIVLTHLILNDMIKIKSEICNIALLFEDKSEELQNLAKLFFAEINKKDPKFIYNMLPEAISRLSDTNQAMYGATLTEKTFQCFAKNILGMLDKDKYSEVLIEKLCLRFNNNNNMVDLRNTAFCLSQLNLNEKGIRMIIHQFELIRPRLNDPEIANSFRILLAKVKKTQKAELKPLIEELQNKVGNSSQEIFDAEGFRRRNENLQKKKKQPRKKRQGRGSRRKNRDSQDSDDMEVESGQKQVPSSSKAARARRPVRHAVIEVQDDDEEDQSSYSQQV